MNRADFSELVERLRESRPVWFDLPSDAPPSEGAIEEIERGLDASLPPDFVWFLNEYGGGDFGLGTVYSADADSEFHLLRTQSDRLPPSFVAISDNGAGDYYGFPVVDGTAQDEVQLLDHETGTVQPRAGGFLDFVKDVALHDES